MEKNQRKLSPEIGSSFADLSTYVRMLMLMRESKTNGSRKHCIDYGNLSAIIHAAGKTKSSGTAGEVRRLKGVLQWSSRLEKPDS
jgi:hypothetical protein